jgi:hypothetical protein
VRAKVPCLRAYFVLTGRQSIKLKETLRVGLRTSLVKLLTIRKRTVRSEPARSENDLNW